MTTRTFLCPPTFYDVTYSINPFMPMYSLHVSDALEQ